jgi:amino acid transporter
LKVKTGHKGLRRHYGDVDLHLLLASLGDCSRRSRLLRRITPAATPRKVIGKSAPWFILAVMLFSYAVRALYIESSSMFVRGGVYRVVKEAMGGTLAKFSVSALLFDYVLTGPISAVSAGQYLAGFIKDIGRVSCTARCIFLTTTSPPAWPLSS